ncbi:MAG: hypothetical protein F7C35_07185, partial [Desulfurococcales archaeon]|nr:hypothetical protein [Desulfurococcales archaeon]
MCIDWNAILPLIITALVGIAGLYFQDRQTRYSRVAVMLNAYTITQQAIIDISGELLEKTGRILKELSEIRKLQDKIALRENRPDNNTWTQFINKLSYILTVLSSLNPILENLEEIIKSIDPNHTILHEIEEIKQKNTEIYKKLIEITKIDPYNPEEVKQIHKPMAELYTIILDNLFNLISNLQKRPPHQTILLKAIKQIT